MCKGQNPIDRRDRIEIGDVNEAFVNELTTGLNDCLTDGQRFYTRTPYFLKNVTTSVGTALVPSNILHTTAVLPYSGGGGGGISEGATLLLLH